MKSVAQDEMFPEGASSTWEPDDVVTPVTSLLATPVELSGTERAVHADFYNNFGDLFDDDDIE